MEEVDTGEVVNIKNETVIPLNHTTGQARLLLVAPIKELALEVISTRKYEKYPMLEEQKRGCLRLFGRGEGTGRSPPYDKDSLENHGAENTLSDTGPDQLSPPGEDWGRMGGLSPSAEDHSHFISRGTVIGRDGIPDLRPAVVHRLVESYNAHVNLLHPILVPHVLEELVDRFLRSIPEGTAKTKQVRESATNSHGELHAGFVGSYGHPESPGNKRKRSPVSGQDYDMPSIRNHEPGTPFRDIDTALVLAVLALGAICEHKGKLPSLASDKPVNQCPDLPLARNGTLKSSLNGPISPRLNTRSKNIDILPGLAYFALATDIIGNQLGGITLKHVYVNILAGLYHGQLGRILESEAYVSKACLTLEHLMKPYVSNILDIGEAQLKDNKYIIAFWTCLQLESDIIAELDCPYSGILRYEELLPPPSASAAIEAGIPFEVIKAYNQQLLLQKYFNQLHGMLYRPFMKTELNPEDQELNNERRKCTRFRTLEAMETSLNEVRKGAWTNDDPPANNILEARLRAKFYSAKAILYRSYVTQILERPAVKDNKSRNATISDQYKNGIAMPQVNKNATELSNLDPKYVEYAKEGIKALIKSTTVFYHLGDPGTARLLVTNVWGTAHTYVEFSFSIHTTLTLYRQFGNVLTLLAVCKDPILGELVNIEELRGLVDNTLRFLKLHS
ncbi:hypothetical protein B0O99DRAFT_527231 [Bisporella sp. PMI_857]|nr:hypothetical protein B0O99DRAFT_527231 [Bisporella sp. PMI_857]